MKSRGHKGKERALRLYLTKSGPLLVIYSESIGSITKRWPSMTPLNHRHSSSLYSVRGQMLIILSEHASIYREEPMKNSSEKPMKKGLYGSQCLLARMLARGPVRRLRSFGASRA